MNAVFRVSRLASILLAIFVVVSLSGCSDGLLVDKETTGTSEADAAASSASTSSSEAPFTQQEGEIFLEPAGTSGPEAFAGETFVTVGTTTTFSIPTSSTILPPPPSTTDGAQTQVASYSGDTQGIYGGSKSKLVADKEGQLDFLEQNPDKAAAFCEALNADPTFQWEGGTQIEPSQLRDYFAELTPVLLTRDIRVTNHGYRDGHPTPRQSVLQAGQMVLVDSYGVPRVRCECGNPLCPPEAVSTAPRYTGPRWPDFDPGRVIVIQPAGDPLDDLVLIDVLTGDIFVRPTGTSGKEDKAKEASVWEIEADLVWDEVENKALSTITWKATVTAGPDGTVTGSGTGIWHVDGTAFEGTKTIGTFTVEDSFNMEVIGRIEKTGQGRVLAFRAVLNDYTPIKQVNNSSLDDGTFYSQISEYLPVWLFEPFPDEEFARLTIGEEPTTVSVAHGNYEGTVTVTPLK